ncbi:MAG: hypothetical protein AAB839_03400 [Patescibacteria group bacterium]|mgnify:CR=1 FL=1
MIIARKKFFSLILATILVLSGGDVFAAMTSTNYQIQWDEMSAGGGNSSSATYQLRDSVADSGGLRAASASYSIDQGFRAGVYDPVVNFIPYIQNRATQVAATVFASNIVTVTTTAGIAVNDWILLVQDEGASQTIAMGKVGATTGTTLTLMSPLTGGAPTIDGSNDYLYRMATSGSVDFGTLSSSALGTHTIGWAATADVTQGYNVYLFDDGNLRTNISDTVADVADGTVNTGGSEYGARSSDSSLTTSTFDTQDTAITTDPQLVASVAANPFESGGFVTLKVAISSAQAGGSYAQTLSVIFVGDY